MLQIWSLYQIHRTHCPTISLSGFLSGGYVLQLIFNLRSLVRIQKAFANWITVLYLLTVQFSNAVHGLQPSQQSAMLFLKPRKEFYRITLILMCITTVHSYCLKFHSFLSHVQTLFALTPRCCLWMVFDSADLLQVLGVQMPHLGPCVLSSLPMEIFALIKVL